MSDTELTKDNTADPETESGAQAADSGTPAANESGQAAKPATEALVDQSALELEKLRAERDELYQRYLRSVADLENYRRRVMREKDELRQFAIAGLVEALIPVKENLGLAVQSAQQNADAASIAQGVSMVVEQLRGALSGAGLVEITPAAGDDFDPHQHESLAHAPSDTIPEEKIYQVVRIGYALNGRILRPASVVLSGGPAPAAETPNG